MFALVKIIKAKYQHRKLLMPFPPQRKEDTRHESHWVGKHETKSGRLGQLAPCSRRGGSFWSSTAWVLGPPDIARMLANRVLCAVTFPLGD